MAGISASMQNYLKAIYELSPDGEGARICDIAAKLGVTKPSTCTAMRHLQRTRMIYRDADRLVFLTSDGKKQAVWALDKVEILHRFLIEVLDIRYETADADARVLEHSMSRETLCAICRFAKLKCSGNCRTQTKATINTKPHSD